MVKGQDQRLKEVIMKDYNPTVLPSKLPFTVQVSLALQGLVNVKEKQSLIVMKVVLRLKWVDV